MDIKAKLRPFYVAKMLYEQTDEDHYLTIAQIMEQLEKDYGISTSRGTVGDDIKALQELGVEADLIVMRPYDRWGFSSMSRETGELYRRYVLARFSAFRNVWWSGANEYALLFSKTEEDW